MYDETQKKKPVSLNLSHSGLVGAIHEVRNWQGMLENSDAKDKGHRRKGGRPRQAEKHLQHKEYKEKKETLPPPSLWKQLKVHSQTVQKQENRCFISYEIPFCHIISLASKDVTPREIGCCGTS